MGKVKAKLKTGGEFECYEHEKYRLWKKDLLDVTKKEDEAYKIRQEKEPVVKLKKALEGSQVDRINKRIDKLSEKGYDDKELKDKISKLEDDLFSALERIEKLEKVESKPGPKEKK